MRCTRDLLTMRATRRRPWLSASRSSPEDTTTRERTGSHHGLATWRAVARYGHPLARRRIRRPGGCLYTSVGPRPRAAAGARRLPPAPGCMEATPGSAEGQGEGTRPVAGRDARARRGTERRSQTSIAVEDPPTLTFRLGTGTAEATYGPRANADHDRVAVARGSPPTSKPKRPDRSVARAKAVPKIDWHHATSVGLPYGGSLIDGTQLPVEGPSWVTWNPVTDSTPNAPNRLYGNEHTIRTIVKVTEAYRAAHPGAARVVIGDISREGGGAMRRARVPPERARRRRLLSAARQPSEHRPRPARSIAASRRTSSTGSSPPALRWSSSDSRPDSTGPRRSSSPTRATRTTCTSASRDPARRSALKARESTRKAALLPTSGLCSTPCRTTWRRA